ETVVLKALAKSPTERYATAQELADDLDRFLKDEPIRARRPALAQRVRRWGRRHRVIVWSAAVGLLGALVVLAGSIGWVTRDRTAQLAVIEDKVARALEEAVSLRSQKKWPEALEAARRAEGLLTSDSREELHQGVREIIKDINMVLAVEE